jgi:hypothetical protein
MTSPRTPRLSLPSLVLLPASLAAGGLLGGCSGPASPSAAAAAARVPPQFTDVAKEAGLSFRYEHGGSGRYYYTEFAGGGGALFDYDGDGWLDVYLVQGAPLPGHKGKGDFRNRLYRSLGTTGGALRFEDVTERAGVDGTRAGKKLYGIGCASGDYDNDGDADLFVTGFHGAILYRNDGNGKFTDVTAAAGIPDTRFAASATFTDVDRDGRLDLAVCEYVRYELTDKVRCSDGKKQADYCQPDYYTPAGPRLYRNLGGGKFQDGSRAAGVNRSGRALGVAAGDVNDDGWPDLFFACDKTPNQLYMNQGKGRFREEAVVRGCALSQMGLTQSGMGVDIRDINGDLRPEMLVTNYWMENNNLFGNRGEGNFMDFGPLAGLGETNRHQVCFGAGLRDFDNDGWPDLYITNGHVLTRTKSSTYGAERHETDQLFLNEGLGQFKEVSSQAGPWFATKHVGRSAAFGDVDNDGDVDVLLVSNEGPAALLRNDGGSRSNWLQLRLRGKKSSRDGIGARIDVLAGGHTRRDEVRSGYSYCAANDLRAHFGLGPLTKADRLTVRWPSGQEDTFENLAANRIYTVTEGEPLQ